MSDPRSATSGGAALAAAYLRERPALERVLREAARKFGALGRLGGFVRLESEEEMFAVDGLRCRVRKDGRIALSELDEALRERTRFRAGLVDTLEAYLGAPLVTRREAREREERAFEAALARAAARVAGAGALRWIEHDRSYLQAQWRVRPEAFEDQLGAALAAAGALPGRGGKLEVPVLAHRLTRDPHAFDPDRSAGRFLERLLVFSHPGLGLAPPLGAEDRETLYALAGLAVDEVSSTVAALGLAGGAPLLEAARRGGQVLALPLRTLYEVLPALEAPSDVYAVENPSVLSAAHRALANHPPQGWPPVVCTSGHLSLSAVRLLDALVCGGARLRYSGDFDAKGLMIARALAARYGASLVPWRFDAGAHLVALGSRGETARSGGQAAPVQPGDFDALERQIRHRGPAYQEGIVELHTSRHSTSPRWATCVPPVAASLLGTASSSPRPGRCMCGLPLASTQGLRASYPLLGAAPIRGEAGQRPPRGLPTYVFECGVCGKRFRRKKNDGRLNPHKSKQGWPCTGRTGYLVDVKY